MGEEVVCRDWAWATVDDDIIERSSTSLFGIWGALVLGFGRMFFFTPFNMDYGLYTYTHSLTLMAFSTLLSPL